ncbi:glycosyltransferase [Corynebacterium sp. H127]|uniref:glycosyltransferase n=1 Tax=Corynebacterium sp. H127 TaxID=3133418 RepID=UPI00309DD82A
MDRIAIFVEDRLQASFSGEVFSSNRRLAGAQWTSLGPEGLTSVLCARLGAPTASTSSHRVDGEVVGLPYYVGIKQAIFQIPKLVVKAVKVAKSSDLVVVKCPGLVGTVGAIAAKATNTPLAVHCVGDVEDSITESPDSIAGSILRKLSKLITQWTVSQADAVRYPTRSYLQEKYPAYDPKAQFWFTDAAVTPVTKVPNPPEYVAGRIVAIGTQERMYKGHDYLIKALAKIIKDYPESHLVLVGKGSCRPELEALATQLGVQDSVEFIDFLEGWNAVSGLMKSAHVFAMPSITEGLPRALLEAMSVGVACVGSDAGGIPELLPDYLLVPKANAKLLAQVIGKLLSSQELQEKAARDCLTNSRLFSGESLQPNIDSWQKELLKLVKSA